MTAPNETTRTSVAGASDDAAEALTRALQRSETRRVQVLVASVLAMMVLAFVRYLIIGTDFESTALGHRLMIAVGVIVYAGVINLIVRRSERADHGRGRPLPRHFWLVTAVIESFVPTINILAVLTYAHLDPVRALVTPPLLIYFVFITVSVLRLRPELSMIGGLLSGLQHAAMVWVVAASSPQPKEVLADYLPYSALIIVTGFVAAVVSREVRAHLLAGLKQARTQAELNELTRNLETARDIQQSLLPREPIAIAGFEMAGWNRPAELTGGDYYDWMQRADGSAIVTIGDVSGHGIGPALLMAVCRAYARASVLGGDPLRTAIRQLNDFLASDFASGRFVTFAIVRLRPNDDEVELLSAGHGPTLLIRRAGEPGWEAFGGDGLPLGILADQEFDEPRRVRLSPGDSLVLITDGFGETLNAEGEMFGAERMAHAIRGYGDEAPEAILQQLHDAVRAFAGGSPQADDMTAVIIRRV